MGNEEDSDEGEVQEPETVAVRNFTKTPGHQGRGHREVLGLRQVATCEGPELGLVVGIDPPEDPKTKVQSGQKSHGAGAEAALFQ